MYYFDHNATTPLLPQARDAWLDASERFAGNPSSPHRIGARADAALTGAREELAAVLGCDPVDLVWTSGATESANMVLHHAARRFPEHSEFWLSAVEHPCVIQAARHYFPGRHRLIPVDAQGGVDLDWMNDAFAERRPALVAVMAVNNETGILHPWREIHAMCRQFEVPFFCDAVQWLGKLPAQDAGHCEYLSGCAHKFGGPKGVGFLKTASRQLLQPLLVGGPQEEGQRAGTENVAGIVSMVTALKHRTGQLAAQEHLARLEVRVRFERELLEAIPGASLVGGANVHRLWNTVSAMMPETDCRHRWVVKLDKRGFAVSTGSACSSGKESPSHVLAAMGLTPDQAGRVLRFSAGWETPSEDWDALLRGLVDVHTEVGGR
jgi:cysteine desulfurase